MIFFIFLFLFTITIVSYLILSISHSFCRDNFIILQALVASAIFNIFPFLSEMPVWNTRGIIAALILHIGVSEPLYYWVHRRLFHGSNLFYTRYHSLHHLSKVTQSFTGTQTQPQSRTAKKRSCFLFIDIILSYFAYCSWKRDVFRASDINCDCRDSSTGFFNHGVGINKHDIWIHPDIWFPQMFGTLQHWSSSSCHLPGLSLPQIPHLHTNVISIFTLSCFSFSFCFFLEFSW